MFRAHYRYLAFLLGAILVSSAHRAAAGEKEKLKLSAVMVSCGEQHSLILLSDGTVLAMGLNGNGQVGQPAKMGQVDRPLRVPGPEKIVGISAGANHSLAWRQDGTIWGWGYNGQNRLGAPIGTIPSNVFEPLKYHIENLKTVSAGGEHNLALLNNGKVLAWGTNRGGEVGNASRQKQFIPTETHVLEKVTTIAASRGVMSLALTEDGQIWSWGSNTVFQLGDGTKVGSFTPGPIRTLTNIKAMAAGLSHGFAVTPEGQVFAWGANSQGHLGLTPLEVKVPTEVPGISEVVAISSGTYRTAALKKDGTVWSWGSGRSGEETAEKLKPAKTPAPIVALRDIKRISAGTGHFLALDVHGEVWAWGDNSLGQCGVPSPGEYTRRPTKVNLPEK